MAEGDMFTSIDLRSSFNQVLMEESSREKAAFMTRHGLYQPKVMPFGLTNGPATMQTIVNHALRGLADRICVNFIDDISIFSRPSDGYEGHVANVRAILQALIDANLFIKAEKCARSNSSATSFRQRGSPWIRSASAPCGTTHYQPAPRTSRSSWGLWVRTADSLTTLQI